MSNTENQQSLEAVGLLFEFAERFAGKACAYVPQLKCIDSALSTQDSLLSTQHSALTTQHY
ncbi:hypothetical protein [Anabaena sp. CCY 9402-a]|uniref:hypothetical protein n=1 Tax=Anabaena sp. CCY 9402-a TaxID=3103867 RepID=UPI0039C71A6E